MQNVEVLEFQPTGEDDKAVFSIPGNTIKTLCSAIVSSIPHDQVHLLDEQLPLRISLCTTYCNNL
jgi:hypothetical protein